MKNKKRFKFSNSFFFLTFIFLFSGCSSTTKNDNEQQETYPELYDISKYEDNLTAFVKMMGDTSGNVSFLEASGRIYAVRPNEQAFPICAVKGVRYVKFEKTEAGYRHYTRDWAFYCDLETGEPIDEFKNPITGEIVKTKQILTRMFDWEWTPNGQVMEGFTGNAWLMDKPLRFPFIRKGDDVASSLELLVQYGSGAAGDEWMHFLSDANDLNNPELSSAPMRFTWTGNSGWMRWLNMGDIQGRTIWQSSGRKYASIDELSPDVKAAAEKYFPGSFDAPETYEKVSYTTMPDTENRKTMTEDKKAGL